MVPEAATGAGAAEASFKLVEMVVGESACSVASDASTDSDLAVVPEPVASDCKPVGCKVPFSVLLPEGLSGTKNAQKKIHRPCCCKRIRQEQDTRCLTRLGNRIATRIACAEPKSC